MRQIGSLKDAQQAQVFADYLITQGITAHSEEDGDEWQIWVRDENKVEEAKHELEEFRQNAADPRYLDAPRTAQRIRAAKEKRRRDAAKNFVQMRGQWSQSLSKRAPLVTALIGTCVVLLILPMFSPNLGGQLVQNLRFCEHDVFRVTGDGMAQIKSGQIWRLATPVLLHGGIIHLLFNMYWLYVLAPQVEMRKGRLKLAGLVIGIAVLSNLAQFYLGPPIRVAGRSFHDPNFLGMSGVVYGILGYLWTKQRYDPAEGFFLNPSTFQILIFFLLAFWVMDIIGMRLMSVANLAHAGGLVSGMAFAYLPVALRRRG